MTILRRFLPQQSLALGAVMLAVLLGLGLSLLSSAASAQETVTRPANAVLVPGKFLRSWDPVTVFFDEDTGPKAGGAEDNPQKYVTVSPAHPGAYTWLNARTLQFRPSEAWPPLTRFTWTVGKISQQLATLMSAPTQTSPANGASELDPVRAITLTLSDPLDAEALAKLITIELRPLPGVEGSAARQLDGRDFAVKVVERADRSAPAQYVINLHDPIPGGMRAILHLKLSLESGLDGGFQDIAFSTATTFHVVQFGCSSVGFPVAAGGTVYGATQAITCPAGDRSLSIQFSANLADVGPIEARNLLRITPAVENLTFATAGNALSVTGRFRSSQLYKIRLEPSAIRDQGGRLLQLAGASEGYVAFAEQPSFAKIRPNAGILERFGPQMLPLQGRGFEEADIRIHKIDPLDRSFWPFPDSVMVDDATRPPGPGEEPGPFSPQDRNINSDELAAQIKSLGSPSLSELVHLPLSSGGPSATFGLDLAPYLSRIAGPQHPGTYLVGLRQIDGSTQRTWVRVQVTDLSLTTVDESDRVRFVVTSLQSGAPVADAQIDIEAVHGGTWLDIGAGRTGADGGFSWEAPGPDDPAAIMRITVKKDDDVLVLNPQTGPQEFANNDWQPAADPWLQWTEQDLGDRAVPDKDLAHLFTERPIYRPEEPVHIKGYVRLYHAGVLSQVTRKATLVVSGPDKAEWRYPVEINAYGSFYHLFNEKTVATGEYTATLELETAQGQEPEEVASVTFQKQAYRLPTFEVRLAGPEHAGSDQPFNVGLTASYYAGGVVVERPIHWKVTQFPFDWMPTAREGFYYSTDARFSGDTTFQSTPVLERDGLTDKQGAATLALNPTIEPTGQPRSYVVEATVTGDDDQTVTNTQQIIVLPPFALGLKAPRYLPAGQTLPVAVLAEGPDGKLLAGQSLTVRLLKRRWNSQLQASDMSQGIAKYVTETVDDKISETTVISGDDPKTLDLPLQGAGVYVVQLEAHDKIGRSQMVSIDLFADGGTPVTWSRAPAKLFKVATEKPNYAPGDTALFLLESPFQSAEALAVVERPDGHNDYAWVDVRNGVGRFQLKIEPAEMPRLPVHFVLMRGRLKDVAPDGPIDLAKPETLAATAWVAIKPVKNIVSVKLDFPAKAIPGQEIDMTVSLQDDEGKPVAGEVTLWMVDQAVLALAPEQRLDPLPDFIIDRGTRVKLRDTRTLTIGALPFNEEPGGAEGAKAEQSLLDNVTVRKNFTPVPYYNPSIEVGPSGTVHLKIKLADSLTVFKVRAKAVSGDERFGYAAGTLKVRLPVMVQPVLPRFLRPGDSFDIAALGRIIEGDGGPGRTEVRVDGLTLTGPATKDVTWSNSKPVPVSFAATVPTPGFTDSGQLTRQSVTVTLGVERTADGAKDAASLTLPLSPDRRPVVQRVLADLDPAKPLQLPEIGEPVREGTYKRTILLSSQPALLRMSAGLDYLLNYPFNCTEQRISQARAELAMRQFREVALLGGDPGRLDRDVNGTIAWIGKVTGDDGRVAFWPGSHGYVFLTAWAVQFMSEARQAGYTIDKAVMDKLTGALTRSLRSDYTQFVSGLEYSERIWALTALAEAGQLDSAYLAELATHSQWLNLEALAQVTYAMEQSTSPEASTLTDLRARMWKGIVFSLYQGHEVYGGLQSGSLADDGLILPSETRSVAAVLRAASASSDDAKRKQLLVDALVTLGQGDGWGSTNASAEAMLALSAFIAKAPGAAASTSVTLREGTAERQVVLDSAHSLMRLSSDKPGPLAIASTLGAPDTHLGALVETRYLPAAPGSQAPANAAGFVVSREELKVQAGDTPPIHLVLDKPGVQIALSVGDVVEEHAELVNAADRNYVAVVVPLAAGLEPLNPALATAPPEAKPAGETTLAADYVAYLDDQVVYFYDHLPKGDYNFAFRTRAQIPGRFNQPPAYAEMMYNESVNGQSNGALVVISPAAK